MSVLVHLGCELGNVFPKTESDWGYERVCLFGIVVTRSHVWAHASQCEIAIAVVVHVSEDCGIDAVRVTCGRGEEVIPGHRRISLELVMSIETGVWDLHASVATNGELAGQRVAVHDDAEGSDKGCEIPALILCQSQVIA
jgi:hypothetical protein